MGRTKGTYTLTSNIEPKVGAPLDARTVVPLKTDLTANGTFDYPYIGLSVFVREDNKRYTLIGSDPTVEANWREEGSGTSTSADHVTYDNTTSELESTNVQDAIDEVIGNLGTAAYKDVPESGNADETQVVMGNDGRLTDSRNANDVYPWAKSVNKPSYTYSEIQNTPTLGTAAAKDYTTSVTEDSTDLITSGAVYDALENIPSDDTWRNIKVNGTEKLGTATNTGAVDFVNGTNTTVSFDTSGNKIKIDAVDTTYEEATTSAAGLMSASDKTKLNNIAPGAEVNVQSDWNQTTTTADDYIKNKPTIPSAVAVKGDSETAYRTGNVNITKGNIGLGNVDNTSDATKKTNFTGSIASGNTGFVTGEDVYTALSGKLDTSLKGANNGVAELDSTGKVPSSQLPSFVDDVIEVEDYAHLPITGVSGKIYVTLDTNLTYRWSGTGYTEISASLALGETSSTAYRGDRGKTAYNHATETKLSTATVSGLYKVAGTAQGHIASLTAVTKSDITALGIPGSDTNTHRPIQVNGTQNLGDNTTPLNLKNGTNITVTADGGNVTIATSAEVNQNAFSNVKVGSTTVAADSKTDTLELVAGSNVTITPDATNDKITIAATDTNTTYTLAAGDSNGQIKVTPSSGDAYNVSVKGLGSNAYTSTAYLPLAGGIMTGSLTFANGTKNVVGDDCAMGDFNVGGTLALQGQNAATSVAFIKQGETWGSGANYGKVTYDGTNFVLTKNIIVQKSNPAITLDNTNTLSAGADSPALSLKLKTADGSAAYTTNVISFIGTNTGDGNNIPVRIGSSSGTTIISAGEAGVQFAAKNSKFNDENLYLVSDSSILLYKDTANDGTISTGPLEAAGFTGTITSGRVVVSNGTRGGLSASSYTIATSVPANAVFTDQSVTASGNHYTPATASGQDKTASASGATAAWSIDVVKGVTLNTDGKGHVTGLSVTSGKIPANPVPSNNITGSGTSGYIAKFNGTNTITNGPAFGSATTTYLRNDGTWTTPTDTNTHRPIQMNGTEILGNNTTALNLKAGSNVSLTNSSGTVTITATNTTYTAGTGLTLDSGAFRTYVPRLNGSSDDSKTIPGVNRFNIREFGNSTLNFPYKEWYHLLTIEGSDNHYATQLALNMTNKAGVYYRKYDNSTWGDWYRLNGALIQKYQTISTTNKWYKLFTISYSQYNYAYLHLLIKAGFENMYEVFLCLRFTPNGIGAADSYAKIIPYNSSSKNVRLYQINDTTFGLAVNAQGATSQIGFELLDMSSEADTLSAWSLIIADPFTELEAGPTAFGNHRYFTGNYADINGTPSLNYLPLAGGTMSGGITFNKVNNAIAYTGTKSTYNMVKFIDNTGDEYGNGISIGGGGLTIIGGGESASAIADGKSGGEEMLYLANDQSVQIITGVQNGLSSAKTFEFKTDGTATFDGKWVGRFTANPTSGQVVITDGTTGGMKSSGYTIATSVPSGAKFTDTTYTFAGGTNSFTVTPLGASAQTVSLTVSDSTKLPLTGGTMTGDIIFNKTGATDLTQVQMKCGVNDYGRVAAGGTASNSGWMEIATADDGAEPIYARQYSGVYSSIVRTATLLDASGNTSFPGILSLSKTVRKMLTGTGTAAQDKGADVSPRYFPARWTFNIGIATPTDGEIVTIKIPCAGHDYGVFLSLDNGTTYKPISVTYGTDRLTTHYGNGTPLTLIYDAAGATNSVYAAAGADARSNVTGGCWRVMNFWDSGNIYDRNRYNCNIKAWGTKIIGGNIIVGINGLYHHLKEGTAFDITYPILYLNGDCNASATTTNTYDVIHFTSTTTQNTSWTAYLPVYIKGTLSGNTFTPVSTTPLIQTVPTARDDYAYILLGMATSATTIYLQERHPIYAFRDGKFGEVTRSKFYDYSLFETKNVKVDYQNWCDTNAMMHANGNESVLFSRFFAQNDEANYTSYHYPCVDSHIMTFTIDNAIQYFGSIAQDIRTNDLYIGGKTHGAWRSWRKVWDNGNLSSQAAASGGTAVSLVTTGEKYTWNNKASQDTKNTAGSTDTSSKIFLIGATSQAANPQTYSDNEIYATSGVLTTKSVQVGGTAATMQYNSTNHCIDFIVT